MRTIAVQVAVLVLAFVSRVQPTLAQSDGNSYSSSSSHSSASSWSWDSDNTPPRSNRSREVVVVNGNQSLAMRNMPLISALELAAKAGPAKVLVSQGARRAILRSTRTVSMAARDKSQEQLLHQLLAGTGVRLLKAKDDFTLVAELEDPADSHFVSIRRVAIDGALGRQITLRMHRVPVQMALQMIEGFAGIRVAYESAADAWPMQGPMVTLDADGASVRETLNSIAKQIGREVRIQNNRVELVTPSA